ncbi:hypothetical protein FQA39_LY18024 [Lamprigera yunnana]|nr:hypothetical protein FQA39_LY18024 [Lamprigera yunnana]
MDLTQLKCGELKTLLKGRGPTCSGKKSALIKRPKENIDDADINKENLTKRAKQKCMSNKRKLKVLNTINCLKSKIEILNIQLAKPYKQVKKINYKLIKFADINFQHSNSIENNKIDINNCIQHKQKFETSNDCDKNVIGSNSFSPYPGIKDSKKILILADSNGKNMSATLSCALSRNNNQIQSIIKPNACLEDVVQDIDNSTRKFTRSDYVIILGGCSVLYFHLNLDPYGDIEKTLIQYFRTNKKPDNLDEVLKKILSTSDEIEENKIKCAICRTVSGVFLNSRRESVSKEFLSNVSKELCILLSNFGYDAALYIIDNLDNLTPERVCSIRFQTNNCEDSSYVPWSVDIPPGNSIQLPKVKSKEIVNVIHITDVHYDPLYEPKSNAECDSILCCESTTGKAQSIDDEAGFWSDYRACDMPWHSVENLMEQITNRHSQVDRVYFTGDIISHQVWNTSREYNKIYIRKVMEKLKETFGSTPVYPILGNHEAHPTDFYPPTEVADSLSINWLFHFLAEEWSRWLPTNTLRTIRKGGYYTVLVNPGFRIIALNSNVCFTSNIWLIYNDKDPYDQLQWLSDILLAAEKNQESVHILSHIPPGDPECFKTWSNEFSKIIRRFNGIITGQFNGHTHFDELKIFFNSADKKEVINVAFNGGSFTTFIGLNPNYRLFSVETNHNRIIDYDQWTYNLSYANKNFGNKPEWYKLYSFKDTYGFEPNDLIKFKNFAEKMYTDLALIQLYQRIRVRNSTNLECDEKCLCDMICNMVSVTYDDLILCQNQNDHSKIKDEL